MQPIATLDRLTPTQREAAEHRKNFRANIAAKAAELTKRKTSQELAAVPVASVEAPLVADPQVTLVKPDAEVVPQPSSPNWFVILAVDPKSRPYPSILEVQKAVASRFGVKVSDLLSARRTANIVFPRQVAYYLCKTLTPFSLPQIGRRFNGRDHTTILSGIRKIDRLRPSTPSLDVLLNDLIADLGGERD